MDSHEAAEFRKNHPMFGFLADDEVHVRKAPPALAVTMKAMLAAHPEQRSQLGEVLQKKLSARYTVPPESSTGPGAMPESNDTVVHVQSLREADLIGSRRFGPFVIFEVRFRDDGTVTSAASDQFIIRNFAGSDGSIEPTVIPKATRGNLNKSATHYRKGQKVRCSDGRVGTVRNDTSSGGTTIVDFVHPGGTGMAVLKDHEIISLA
jgi:hypothetical protein